MSNVYLTELTNQKKKLATILNNKGVVASESEKFNTLVPKVAQVQNLKGEEKVVDAISTYNDVPESIVQLEYPKSKNLFDINNPVYAAASTANASFLPKIENGIIYFNTWYAQRGGAGFVIPIQSGETFTISFDVVTGNFVSEICYCESIENGVMVNRGIFPQTHDKNVLTFTQREGKNYIVVILDCIDGYYKAGIKNLQVELGSVATPYQPYAIQKNINLQLSSKNLFDKTASERGGLNADTGYVLTNTTDYTSGFIPIENLKTYFCTGKGAQNWACLYDENKNFLSPYLLGTGSSGSFSLTINNPKAKYMRIVIFNSSESDLRTVQIEPGTTATPYTPFISDLTAVNVTRCEKNVFDITSALDTNNWVNYQDGYSNYHITGLKPNTKYTFSMSANNWTGVSDNGFYLSINTVQSKWNEECSIIHSFGSVNYCPTSRTITSSNNGDLYLQFYYVTAERLITCFDGLIDVQLEEGSARTAYKPYQGQTYTPTATGEVTGITSIYPITNILTDNAGALITVKGGAYKEILPSTDKNGITKIYQEVVGSNIDENIKPENIKKGITILGVTGTLTGQVSAQSTLGVDFKLGESALA